MEAKCKLGRTQTSYSRPCSLPPLPGGSSLHGTENSSSGAAAEVGIQTEPAQTIELEQVQVLTDCEFCGADYEAGHNQQGVCNKQSPLTKSPSSREEQELAIQDSMSSSRHTSHLPESAVDHKFPESCEDPDCGCFSENNQPQDKIFENLIGVHADGVGRASVIMQTARRAISLEQLEKLVGHIHQRYADSDGADSDGFIDGWTKTKVETPEEVPSLPCVLADGPVQTFPCHAGQFVPHAE